MTRVEIVTTRPHTREIVIAKNAKHACDLIKNVMERSNYKKFDNITFSAHKISDIEAGAKDKMQLVLSGYCNQVQYEYEVEDRS